jgi:hypothetical protein
MIEEKCFQTTHSLAFCRIAFRARRLSCLRGRYFGLFDVQAFEVRWMRHGSEHVQEEGIIWLSGSIRAAESFPKAAWGPVGLVALRRVAYACQGRDIHYSESRIKSTLHIMNPHFWLQYFINPHNLALLLKYSIWISHLNSLRQC